MLMIVFQVRCVNSVVKIEDSRRRTESHGHVEERESERAGALAEIPTLRVGSVAILHQSDRLSSLETRRQFGRGHRWELLQFDRILMHKHFR